MLPQQSVIRGMQVDLYLLDLHQAAWRRQWREASIRVPSNVSLARDINAALYYLTSEAPASLAMTRQRRFFGIPPAGVSRTGEGNYNGHIFWDQGVTSAFIAFVIVGIRLKIRFSHLIAIFAPAC